MDGSKVGVFDGADDGIVVGDDVGHAEAHCKLSPPVLDICVYVHVQVFGVFPSPPAEVLCG